MNLREFCAIEGFGTAVLTTYQFDPLFFERVVLKDLLASGVRRIVVLADGRQSDGPLEAARGQLVELGRRYRLFQVRQAGAFHAKICVKLAAEGAAVACGSTNLTYPGWLGLRSLDADVGNREASGAWRVAGGTPQAADLSLALRRLLDRLPAPSRAEVEQGAVADWLATPTDGPGGRLLVSGSGDPIASQLAARWRGRRFSRMWMATGSTDEGGAMLAWAASEFGVASAVVETDPASAAFRPELLERLPLEVSVRARPPRPRPHLKVAVFEGDGGLAAVYGSANCSSAAWLLGPERGGNTEAVVVLDSVERDAVSGLVDLGVDGLSGPRGLRFGSLPEREGEPAKTPPRLVLASLTRSTQTLQIAFDRPLATGSSVRLTVGAAAVAATPWRDGRWTARLKSPADESRTDFVTGVVEGPEPSRCVCWLEDAELLEALQRRALDLGSVARLGGGGEDPGRTLKSISKVAQWLLGDWTRDDERAAGWSGTAEPTEPVPADAAPVTPEQIFRSVEEFRARGSLVLAQLSGGGISLAGIMRLVFGDGRADDDRATDALSDELSDDGGSEAGGDGDEALGREENGTDPAGGENAAGDRARLIGQVSRFVDGLADETFEERCTARQLQQAVAFPLACYLLAARGGVDPFGGRPARLAGDREPGVRAGSDRAGGRPARERHAHRVGAPSLRGHGPRRGVRRRRRRRHAVGSDARGRHPRERHRRRARAGPAALRCSRLRRAALTAVRGPAGGAVRGRPGPGSERGVARGGQGRPGPHRPTVGGTVTPRGAPARTTIGALPRRGLALEPVGWIREDQVDRGDGHGVGSHPVQGIDQTQRPARLLREPPPRGRRGPHCRAGGTGLDDSS